MALGNFNTALLEIILDFSVQIPKIFFFLKKHEKDGKQKLKRPKTRYPVPFGAFYYL